MRRQGMRIEGGQTPPGPEGSNGSSTLFVASLWRHPPFDFAALAPASEPCMKPFCVSSVVS